MAEELNEYAAKDTRYRNAAITTTMSKFGPSGSSKNTNSALEHTRAVAPKSSNEIFLDLELMRLF